MALNWDGDTFSADLAHDDAGLVGNEDLRTVIIISLFSWSRANDDDALPDDTNNRMGWWGDTYSDIENEKTGSRLWLLRREKLTTDTMSRFKEYCLEALQHLIDDGVAARIEMSVTRFGLDGLSGVIDLYYSDGTKQSFDFSDIWGAVVGNVN